MYEAVSLGGMFLTLRRIMSPSSFKWKDLGSLKVEGLKMKATRSWEKSGLYPLRNFESLLISVLQHRQLLNERLSRHQGGSGENSKFFTAGSQAPDLGIHSLVTVPGMLSYAFLLDILHFIGAFPKLSRTVVRVVMYEVCLKQRGSDWRALHKT